MTTEPAASSPALTRDVPCVTCSYNLRGLNPGGVCPECATSIAISLSEQSGRVSTYRVIWARCMVVGLIGWVALSALALTQTRFAHRSSEYGRLIRMNFPGPRVWIIDLQTPYADNASNPHAFAGPTYAVGCLLIAYLITSPRRTNPLESMFSLRRIARWFTVILGAVVIGDQVNIFRREWTDSIEHSIPVVATVLLYLHLAAVAGGLGLRADARSLRIAACIAGVVMAIAVVLRYLNYDPSFQDWPYRSPLGRVVFVTYLAIAIVGAVLAAGSMVRMALAMIPAASGQQADSRENR